MLSKTILDTMTTIMPPKANTNQAVERWQELIDYLCENYENIDENLKNAVKMRIFAVYPYNIKEFKEFTTLNVAMTCAQTSQDQNQHDYSQFTLQLMSLMPLPKPECLLMTKNWDDIFYNFELLQFIKVS
jgi:hypothetical protein